MTPTLKNILKYTKRLEALGFNQSQAEEMAKILQEMHNDSRLSDYIKDLREDVEDLKDHVEKKGSRKMSNDLYWKFVPIMFIVQLAISSLVGALLFIITVAFIGG